MRKLVSKESSVVVLWRMMLLLLLQLCFSITACIQKEREALLRFKNSFYDDPSHRLASWNGADRCNWNGVGCNQTTGHVTIIDLRSDTLQVDFYSRLRSNFIELELKYLNHLDLSGNDFNYTQIPNFLGSMVELTYLNLSRSFFSGKIPSHLGNLSKLEILDLRGYSFDDTRWVALSDDIEWISHLSSLHTLDLSGMNFSKAINLIQVICSLPSLSSLTLSLCSLQNNHFSLGSCLNYSSFLSRIQVLDLFHNQLSGRIPTTFQNMTSLKYLDLASNNFTAIFKGGISSFIENNCGLEILDLSSNLYFGGDVFESSYESESMGCDLQVLNLGYTFLRTKIPDWLAKFKNLKTIDLQFSQIYGLIPTSLGYLSSLKYLDLSINNLTGAIPTSFERLLNLEVLDISANSLEGVLTEASFANLSRLHTLNLGYNENLSLEIKANWNPPFQLIAFDASSICCFGSEFPQWLQTQKALVDLRLSNTNLSISSIPTCFKPKNLTTLNLSNNKIMGPLPTNIGDQMPKLEMLLLNDNLIHGSLPRSICQWKNLTILDLSNNRLSGMLQDCILNPNLYNLDLSFNNFSGIFPYSPENMTDIRKVYLRDNNFEESIPTVLKNAKNLEILDLTGNKFSGTIPIWVGGNLGSLKFLILQDNLFNGTIPLNLCNLTNLQILNLAHNQLEGSIPPNLSNFHQMNILNFEYSYAVFCGYIDRGSCFGGKKNFEQSIKSSNFNYSMEQLSSMVSIDISNNSLVGIIPSEITKLTRLIGLNLSHNNLTGIVPAEIEEMESLESLDLSFNQLSGPIPQSLSRLNSLGVLILSHNNFSGNIPREGHLSTFSQASSFDNNSYLCGDPLPIKCVIENSSKPSFSKDENQEDK